MIENEMTDAEALAILEEFSRAKPLRLQQAVAYVTARLTPAEAEAEEVGV